MYSYWVPQIWLDVRRGVARSLRVEYIVGSTAARLFFPVYFLGCPENIAFLRPTPLVWVLAAYSLAQAAILVLQRVLGALFFIPPSLRPEVYNYCAALPSFDEESGALGQARTHGCPICLLPVGPAPSEMVHSASPPDSAHSTSLPAAHAVTPCRHVYHDACLAQWMEIKLECPICRTPLPPRVDC
ncbi:hypothetical protein IWW50_007011 [Coemansia erecta]|nr:hypothetical protein IWW50_007011 [Coemansia erecta]